MQEQQITPSRYDNFEHIHEAAAFGPQDQACLDEIREVLARHDRLDRIGVNLLHQHFPMSGDEILMETCDDANRTLTLRPVKVSELDPDDVIFTSYSLDQGSALQACSKKDHGPAMAVQACSKKDHGPAMAVQACSKKDHGPAMAVQACSKKDHGPAMAVQACSKKDHGPAMAVQACSKKDH